MKSNQEIKEHGLEVLRQLKEGSKDPILSMVLPDLFDALINSEDGIESVYIRSKESVHQQLLFIKSVGMQHRSRARILATHVLVVKFCEWALEIKGKDKIKFIPKSETQ